MMDGGKMASVELARMTWKEAQEARDRGAVVLIPIGTLEQNGSMAPLSSDTLVADEVARRVAEATGSVVTPPVHFGYSPPFINYPGTVSLRPETLQAVVLDILDNLIANGFQRIVMVNCHIFNEPIMEQAATQIRKRSSALLGNFNPITLAQGVARQLEPGIEAKFGHGTEPIASMLLSFAPDTVRTEAADPRPWGNYQGLTAPFLSKVKVGNDVFGVYFDQEEVSETGGSGDPGAADGARGAEIMRRVVESASEFVRTFAGLQISKKK
jgi:creatinine amidohydrolase